MDALERVLRELEHFREIASLNGNFNAAAAFEKSKEIVKQCLSDEGWIPVEDQLPKERDSMFARWKGTDKWSKSMFEKISDDVNVTVEYEDGTRKTITAHTLDGTWSLPNRVIQQKVIAWRPLPEPYRNNGG